jgi:hypothetical protein
MTNHAYFFVEDGRSYSQGALEQIGADFESVVYPQTTAAFGNEWTPGVDSDPRISILHAGLRGAAGFFSMSDEYPRAIVAESNERETLYLDISFLDTPGPSYNALLAHELQHMVHWWADPSEEAWVNEGLSQVAAEIAGGGSDWAAPFLVSPDTQLNYWPPLGDAGLHYAASEMFFSYVLSQYGGRQDARNLLQTEQDGIAGLNEYLADFGTDFRGVFADWVVANYLDHDEGRYSQPAVSSGIQTVTTVRRTGSGEGEVSQFAADYLEVDLPSGSILTFDGADDVTAGIPARDGPFWYSGQADNIDSRLTREVDLSGVTAATLRYSTWFEIERGWDYAYVAASTDGGDTWKTLPGQLTTNYDPVRQAYGPGYSGESEGWVDEEVDLSEFTGRRILLRFEYITDDASGLTGFAVDDIEIPEINYRDDVSSADAWQAEGFRIDDGPMVQEFIVQKVVRGQPDGATPIVLDENNRAEIEIDGGATIVIAATTEGTRQKAAYRWELAAPKP